MNRYRKQRLADIIAAIEAIRLHLAKGDLSDGLVFDAVRVRLIEIGEAVKALPECVIGSPTGTSTPRMQSFKPPSSTTFLNWSRQ